MKNNKAIEILQSHTNLGYGIVIEGDTKEIKEALNLAIKALEFQDNVKAAYYSSSGFELKKFIRELLKGEEE